jgi:hypothetical protein
MNRWQSAAWIILGKALDWVIALMTLAVKPWKKGHGVAQKA